MLGRLALLTISAFALASCNGGGGSRDQIKAVGSSTVYPFTKAVAEAFVQKYPGRKAPVVESTGTGAGIKQFCAGVGPQYPDLVNASRRLKKSEFEACTAAGAGDIMEIPIGIDGVALAESKNGPKLSLTKKDIYLALAANPMGKPNTAKTWRDVNPKLPAIPIQVYGPPATSGTRDALVELMMEPGCLAAYPEAKDLKAATDPAAFDAACRRIRDDGAFVDKGENDNVIVQGLSTNPNAIGIFGYSYLEENADRLRGIPIEGVEPTYDTIAMSQYPGARQLFIYVKIKHVAAVPGLPEFLDLYSTMWNPGGELAKHGLIAAPTNTRFRASEIIATKVALKPDELH